MQKNVVLAIVLSTAFLFLWSVWMTPKIQKSSIPPASSANPPAVVSPGQTPGEPEPGSSSASVNRSHRATPLPDLILETDREMVRITPLGGGIRSWRLKTGSSGVDLVAFREGVRFPLATFPEVVFRATARDLRRVVLEGRGLDGVILTKTLALSNSDDLHEWTLRWSNPTRKTVTVDEAEWGWGPGLGTTASEEKENPRLVRTLVLANGETKRLSSAPMAGPYRWAALDNRYFLVALVPEKDSALPVRSIGSKEKTVLLLGSSLTLQPGETREVRFKLYVGPKGYTHLARFGLQLEKAVDFGFFGFLGQMALKALYFLKRLTGNYGLAIVLLTLGLQVVLLPLSLKSYKAAQAMKKLQPQIAMLQKQYKSDPKRLNVEMMHLYKKSGSNPLGGCLPMLLQLPIFWALFTTLRNAYELRGAPFMGWIRDLSAHDPYYLLPILMGASMFFQQRLSGAVSDPTQRQMMVMMPVIFTVMFLNFPSGLVLYWLTNNLLNMAGQWGYQRFYGGGYGDHRSAGEKH